jgi:glycosyltransferase involved in cell wall biosynthesis
LCCLKADSEEDMAEKLYQLMTDHNLREETVKKGLEYSKKFTWEKTVVETLKIYEETLSENRKRIC